ncbi:uncharacterized protein EAF01_008952 [Botrytis porri]|uniref:RNase MRP protein 1 RNA binding domain-containing protein n=1 Tax=Botrytis porri TaxID=87229 RepID=A0A4Z1KM23_9HELO|nr:uncharacterized protein EAF01_008952 [Botrytis porri]KAF7897986.1 hypothetical protein EAF01_008952 [Botrytis porri]TGO82265.1 hypothetical protein BPOR_0876g00020 [Botrytis porri]
MNILTPNPHHASLLSLTQLLHLTHHRNKNQHRLSKWYISFGIFRRQVSRLLSIIPEHVMESSRGKVKGKARERKEREERELQRLVRFIQEEVVPGCYLAFSQLVANNQYATLGLMLMGCLARLYKVLGALRVLNAEEIAEQAGVVNETPQLNAAEMEEDMGEKIVRDVPVPEVEDNQKVERKEEDDTGVEKAKPKKRKQEGKVVELKTSKLASSDSMPAKPPKKKRKKKGGDAIEDLFAGLI